MEIYLSLKQIEFLISIFNKQKDKRAIALRTFGYLVSWQEQISTELKNISAEDKTSKEKELTNDTTVEIKVNNTVYNFLKSFALQGEFTVETEDIQLYDKICIMFESEV